MGFCRQILPPRIASRNFLYFDRLRVVFAPIRVTVRTAEGHLGTEFYDVKRLLPKLMSFTDADLRLGELNNQFDLFFIVIEGIRVKNGIVALGVVAKAMDSRRG